MNKSHRRLQTQTERSNLLIKDQCTNNLVQTLPNQLSFNDRHKATAVSGIMNKIRVNKDARDSMIGHEQMRIELDNFFEEMQENELLVTES